MNKTISSVSALIALSASMASAEIRAAPFSNIGLDLNNGFAEYLDMDGDSNDDFYVNSPGSLVGVSGEVVVDDTNSIQATRFAFGSDVGSSETNYYTSRWTNWIGLGRGYAGVNMVVGSETNWGWIEFYLPDSSTGWVVRGAWETVPDKSITAGAWPGTVIPGSGPYAGGNTVIITNSNFGTVTNVTVGGVGAPIQDSGTNWVRITMPAMGSVGAKDIVIQTDSGELLLADAYTYNPAGVIGRCDTDWTQWQEVAGLPAPRAGLAAETQDGLLYAIGGRDGLSNDKTNMFVYNGTDWLEAADLPTQRYYLAVGTLGGALHAVGGWTGGAVTNVYRYNGTNWLNVAGLPSTMAYQAVGTWGDDLYAIGGVSGAFAQSNVFRYNGTNWTVAAGIPSPRFGLAAGTLGGSLYAIGGQDNGGTFRTNVYRYNGTNWQEVAGLPAPRFQLAAATLGDSLYAIGGQSAGSSFHTNVYRYDGTNWQEVAGLPAPRYELAAATLGGAIYAVGGRVGSTYATNVYRYPWSTLHPGVSPSSGFWTGSYEVMISGTNLGNGTDITNVTLCGISATILPGQSATQIVVVAGAAGGAVLGDVRVFSTSFGETVKSNVFAYLRETQAPLVFSPTTPQAYLSTNALSVSGGSGTGAVSYTVLSGPGLIVDGTKLIATNGSGTILVCATKAQDDLYYEASVTSSVTAVKWDQAIEWAQIGNQRRTDIVLLAATASSGLPVTFAVVSGPAVLANGTNVTFTGAGLVSIVASQSGDANWNEVAATNTFRVGSSAILDFDGDGITDFGCYYGPWAKWYFYMSSEGYDEYQVGPANATPITGDFDGDGITDFGCYYGPWAMWYFIKSTEGYSEYQVGPANATPITGDFDGDGAMDFGSYYGPLAMWYFVKSSEGYSDYQFGPANATPITGDFDGDGTTDFGCYYGPWAMWYFIKSTEGYSDYQVGQANATPITGDFDGDGATDFGSYYGPAAEWYLIKSSEGYDEYQVGPANATPITDDFDADGITDFGCYYGPWAMWYFMKSTEGYSDYQVGPANATPITGDFDGDGAMDFGSYYGPWAEWYLIKSSEGYGAYQFGPAMATPLNTPL